MRRVLTYGTFDALHWGHIRLLQRARELGDCLFVGLSTDRFNALKGKEALLSYAERETMLRELRSVDDVFPEEDWIQKRSDISRLGIAIFVMGDDWAGKFDDLKDICQIVYLPRTPNISTAAIKTLMPQNFSDRPRGSGRASS